MSSLKQTASYSCFLECDQEAHKILQVYNENRLHYQWEYIPYYPLSLDQNIMGKENVSSAPSLGKCFFPILFRVSRHLSEQLSDENKDDF